MNPSPTTPRGPLDRAKLMLEAKAVVEHYDRVVSGIPDAAKRRDGREADFVITIEDYRTLRDFALQEHSKTPNPETKAITLPLAGVLNVDDPADKRNREWGEQPSARSESNAINPNGVTIAPSLYIDLIRWFEKHEDSAILHDEGLPQRLNDAAHQSAQQRLSDKVGEGFCPEYRLHDGDIVDSHGRRITVIGNAGVVRLLNERDQFKRALNRQIELTTPESATHARIIEAIDAEPELPGDMPDEMWNAISTSREYAVEAMRIAVRQTKRGIKERLGLPARTDSRGDHG